MSNAGRDALVAMLSRLKNDLQGLNLAKPDVARASLQTKYPLNGDYLLEVRRLCQRGVSEGWLCDGVANGARSSRIASPSKYFPFSIEAVELQGSGQGHGHPKGEVTLAWPLDGTPRFCGLDPGWSACAPGSKHVPSVSGGKMFLLHFLPEGKIDWDVKVKSPSRTAVLSDGTRRTASSPAGRTATRRATARG